MVSDADNISLPDKEDASVAPMHLAAVNGHLGCLKIFIESGMEVDLRDEFGRTPLLAAGHSYKSEIMK